LSGADPDDDTDGDGFIDWLELTFGSDPNDAASLPAVEFTPGDMAWASVNNVVQDIESDHLELCPGDCFQLHATGWAMSWEVMQGGEWLTEVEPDTPDSCISAKWCIDEDTPAGTEIIIASSTPTGGDPIVGYVVIHIQDDAECGPQCELEITQADGGPAPQFVCVGEELTLKAAPAADNHPDCACEGEYEWQILNGTPGGTTFVDGNTGQEVTILVEEPGEIILSATQGDCSGGESLNAIEIDLDIDTVADDDEENPGGFVRINGDNDNGSSWVAGTSNTIPTVRDLQTQPVPNENDLLVLQISAQPDDLEGEFRLQVTYTGEGRIKFWDTMSKQVEISLAGGQTTFQPGDLPDQLYVEGTENSAALRDVEIELEFVPAGEQGGTCSDKVKLSVTPVVTSFTAATANQMLIAQVNPPEGPIVYTPVGSPDTNGGIDFNASVIITNAGSGQLYIVQNALGATGGITFTPASGLDPVTLTPAGENFTDLNGNEQYDIGEPFTDLNGNGKWDSAEEFQDANFNGQYDPQMPFPLLDAAANPPPATNIFAHGPGDVQGQTATVVGADQPMIQLPNPFQIQSIDHFITMETWVVWVLEDGSIWPMASIKWEVFYEAVRVPIQGGGEQLVPGSNAGVTANPMTYNHSMPTVVPPVANLAGFLWE